MKYIVDHDYHIHTQLSSCSRDPEQTTEAILAYGEKNHFSSLVVTDHFWDSPDIPGASSFYLPQNWEHITEVLPLPQGKNTRFFFGCETELRIDMTVGITEKHLEEVDFCIIPTTHLHMKKGFVLKEGATFADRAEAYISRLDGLLDMDLPFHKIGIAHLGCDLLAPNRQFDVILNMIPDGEFRRLFTKAAKVGVGIELNASDFDFAIRRPGQKEAVLRVFRFAKECGCKFYLGSDAHHPAALDAAPAIFENAVTLLGLTEDDKFRPLANA